MMQLAKRNFFDDFMMRPFDAFFDNAAFSPKAMPALMKTDIKETEDAFELIIDLPGVEKENIQASLKDGYLEITAETHTEKEEGSEQGTYLRKERFDGKCSRSFYIGEGVAEEDIKARFESGTLVIDVPKKVEPKIEDKKTIAIEG